MDSLAQPRYDFGVCVTPGHIYVFGGKGEHSELLGSIERYDPIEEFWDMI